MTLQQLKYIVAIDRYRNFAKAAAELDVTQPTLSALLLKLEEELGVRLFERSNKSVCPTAIGETVIRQAQKILGQTELISETIAEQKGEVAGSLSIGIGPSIAPYLMPWFIKKYTDSYSDVNLTVNEMKGDAVIESLRLGKIDIGVAISGHVAPEILEIPFYSERFHVYMAKECLLKIPVFNPADLMHEKMWIMKESQCMRESAFSFCKTRSIGRHIYEAGSIETLIRIVDINGGFTCCRSRRSFCNHCLQRCRRTGSCSKRQRSRSSCCCSRCRSLHCSCRYRRRSDHRQGCCQISTNCHFHKAGRRLTGVGPPFYSSYIQGTR